MIFAKRKFFFSVFILVAISISSSAFSGEFYSDGDVIVVMKSESSEGANLQTLSAAGIDTLRTSKFAETFGARVKRNYPSLSRVGKHIFTVFHSDTKKPEEFAKELLKNPDVIAASPNYKIQAAVYPDDPYITDEGSWGIDFVNAPEAWEISSGDNGVYVVVLDSGIDYTNPDLAANVDLTYGKNFLNSNSYPKDDYSQGHGTHVAGIIGAVGNNSKGIAGICWNVKLIPLKILDSSGSGSVDNVMNALDYVVQLIDRKINVKVINMSFEVSSSLVPNHENLVQDPLWRSFRAIDELNKAVMVVAAGNYGNTVGSPDSRGYYVYPASFKGLNNLISVSAIDSNGNIAQFSSVQSSSKNATMSAPGVKILSTILQDPNDGTPTLGTLSGTSMAAPYVSGAAALLASVYSDRTAYQIKRALLTGRTQSDAKLDILAALNFQEIYKDDETVLPSEAVSDSYDDWEDYDEVPYSSGRTSDGSGGGCNEFQIGIFGLLIFIPLVKKSKC